MAHIRIRHTTKGGYVHASVWSSEGGAETTHGRNGTLIFRQAEFDLFREALLIGAGPSSGVEFIDDPLQAHLTTDLTGGGAG